MLAGNTQATVTWQVNTESDLKHYTLHWGSAANNLADSVVVEKTASSKTVTGLTNDTLYFFALSAEDTSGNKSKPSEAISITPTANADTTPPTLLSSNPVDNSTDVPPRNPSITIVFSEPMNTTDFALTIVPPFRAFDASSDEKLESVWSNNDMTLTVKPSASELVLENTSFTLTLSNAKDKAGNALSGDNDITFMTGKDIPRVVSSVPADGATNVPAPAPELSKVTLNFSKAVNPGTFKYDYDMPRCEDPVWEIGNLTVNFSCRLYDGHTYTLFYQADKTVDDSGLEGSISFTTIADTTSPIIIDQNPSSNATNVPLSSTLYLQFDDEMDQASTFAAVSSSSPLNCTWKFTAGFTDRLECPVPNLADDTTYIITVDTTAKDTSGNPFSLEFCRGNFPCSYDLKFSTGSTIDETRPTIDTELSEPDNGTTNVELTSTINVIFSEKMNEASVERVFRADTGDIEIAGTFGWFNSGMVFFPTDPLPACTNINVTISNEATDRALNFLASPYDITFKTVCS